MSVGARGWLHLRPVLADAQGEAHGVALGLGLGRVVCSQLALAAARQHHEGADKGQQRHDIGNRGITWRND